VNNSELLKEAKQLLAQKNWHEAERALKLVIRLNLHDWMAYFALGLAQQNQCFLPPALHSFTKALRLYKVQYPNDETKQESQILTGILSSLLPIGQLKKDMKDRAHILGVFVDLSEVALSMEKLPSRSYCVFKT